MNRKTALLPTVIAIAGLSMTTTLLVAQDAAKPPAGAPAAAEQAKERTTPSGLKIIDTASGDGTAKTGDTVWVHYTGTLDNGTKFDSSLDRGEPFSFVLGEGRVIKGWDEGVVGMKVGDKRTLIIPPQLGYGAQGAGGTIPPNATLHFDIEMLGFKRGR